MGVAPGSVRTPMLTNAAREADPEDPDRALETWAAAHPIKRVIEPEEIANVVLFLAGDGASAMSGATVLVDRGVIAGTADW